MYLYLSARRHTSKPADLLQSHWNILRNGKYTLLPIPLIECAQWKKKAYALRLAKEMSFSIATLESVCATAFGGSPIDIQKLKSAIDQTWSKLRIDAQKGTVSYKTPYLENLYMQLANAAGIANAGCFTDPGKQWEPYYRDGCGDEGRCEDAWVIAELYWGNYIQHLKISSGWLLMNAIRVQHGLTALMPALESMDQYLDAIRWAGPNLFDAESLRFLLGLSEKEAAAD